MAKACKKTITWPDIFNCHYCPKTYCDEHAQAENHGYPKVLVAKHIDRDYLRKCGTNTTTGGCLLRLIGIDLINRIPSIVYHGMRSSERYGCATDPNPYYISKSQI